MPISSLAPLAALNPEFRGYDPGDPAVDPDDDPVRKWRFVGGVADGEGPAAELPAPFLLIPTGKALEGAVLASGFAPRRLRSLTGPRTVRLKPGLRLEVQVDGLLGGPTHQLAVEGGLAGARDLGLTAPTLRRVHLDATGAAVVTLDMRGTYTLSVRQANGASAFAPSTLGTLRVRDSDFGATRRVAYSLADE